MTDHAISGESHDREERSSSADTIHRELDYIRMALAIFAPHGFDSSRSADYSHASDIRASLDRLQPAFDAYEAERQQAIDALREIAQRDPALQPELRRIARAALLSLGEQP